MCKLTFILTNGLKLNLSALYRQSDPPQFSSVAQSCPTLCDPMNCSTPGLPVRHQLPEFTQTHVHWVGDAIQHISSSVIPFSSCLQSFPASGSFQMSQLFASGGPSIGVSPGVQFYLALEFYWRLTLFSVQTALYSLARLCPELKSHSENMWGHLNRQEHL